jgi:hypothetical protein
MQGLGHLVLRVQQERALGSQLELVQESPLVLLVH